MAGVGMLYMTFVLPPIVEMTEVVKDMPSLVFTRVPMGTCFPGAFAGC